MAAVLFWGVSGVAGEVGFLSPDAEAKSEDGVVTLKWSKGAEAYELQQARAADFSDARMRYTGPDRGSVITGLAEGEYYFRVREYDGAWSEPVHLTVKYMPMVWVWTLVGTGLVVFAATVGAVVTGHLRGRGDYEEGGA